MDGSQFERQSFGLKFSKSNVSDYLEKIEAQLYYNYADHIMDNFRLRPPQKMPMEAKWTGAAWEGACQPHGTSMNM